MGIFTRGMSHRTCLIRLAECFQIPATHMKWIIPTLFSGYASCLFLSPPATTTPDVRVEVKREGKLNGTHTNGVKPESIVAVAQPAVC
jgi:hypothetical protein